MRHRTSFAVALGSALVLSFGSVASASQRQTDDGGTTVARPGSVVLVERLVALGSSEADASRAVAMLTPEDIDVLTANPEMMHLGGDLDASDGVVIAAGIIGAVIVLAIIF